MPAPVTRTDEILVELVEEIRGLRADLAKPEAGEASTEQRAAGDSDDTAPRTPRRRTRQNRADREG